MLNRIREHRKRQGLTLQALADKAGTTVQQISRLELGERGLDDRWLSLLAPALNVSKADLLLDGSPGDLAPEPREFAKDHIEARVLRTLRRLSERERDVFVAGLSLLGSEAEVDDVPVRHNKPPAA